MSEVDVWRTPTLDIGEITTVGWVPRPDLTWEEYDDAMGGLLQTQRSLNWIVGDGLVFGERKYGEMYAQVIDALEVSYQWAADVKWVAGAVPYYVRRPTLSWTHHKYVAKLAPEIQRKWLEDAELNQWSTAELRAAMNGEVVRDAEWRVYKARSRRRLFTEMVTMYEEGVNGEVTYKWIDALSADEKTAVLEIQEMAHGLVSFCDEIVGRLGNGKR